MVSGHVRLSISGCEPQQVRRKADAAQLLITLLIRKKRRTEVDQNRSAWPSAHMNNARQAERNE
eukprot:6213805-Pleurochrysis_carterae.AAC.1